MAELGCSFGAIISECGRQGGVAGANEEELVSGREATRELRERHGVTPTVELGFPSPLCDHLGETIYHVQHLLMEKEPPFLDSPEH